MSANRALLDATLRHSIALRRYTTGEVRGVLRVLSESEQELAAQLAKLDPNKWGTQRTKALLERVRAQRADTMAELKLRSMKEMKGLVKVEAANNIRMLQRSVPLLGVDYATPAPELLRSVVTQQPFAGGNNAARTLEQWWDGVQRADQQRILESIQMGVVQGEDTRAITSRVMSAADLTRKNAEAVVRTAVNHVSNGAREEVFQANDDIIAYETWVATLDGRTTLICASRDGHKTPVGKRTRADIPGPYLEPEGARPPAHPQCRSVMVGGFDVAGVAAKAGQRPTVRDTRTREERERDFRAEARDQAGRKWKNMDAAARNRATARQRDAWAKEAVGQVPSPTTYDEWLRGQPKEFQEEVLGVGKAKLFREGRTLDQFVDDSGKELTLQQLGAEQPVMGGLPAEAPASLDLGTADINDVKSRHEDMRASWEVASPALTEADYSAMRSYQGAVYSDVNSSLRGTRSTALSQGQREVIEQLDSAFEGAAPLEQDVYTYRFAEFDDDTASSLFGGSTPREGAVFEDKAFVSTSLGTMAPVIENLELGAGQGIYNFRIRVPQGTHALFMEPKGNEAEVLLNRGTRFRVLSVVKTTHFKGYLYDVDVEVLR